MNATRSRFERHKGGKYENALPVDKRVPAFQSFQGGTLEFIEYLVFFTPVTEGIDAVIRQFFRKDQNLAFYLDGHIVKVLMQRYGKVCGNSPWRGCPDDYIYLFSGKFGRHRSYIGHHGKFDIYGGCMVICIFHLCLCQGSLAGCAPVDGLSALINVPL